MVVNANTQASQVKILREMTGAGFMDCKQALSECGGDFEKAKDFLRKKGLASAEKRAAKQANEGIVFVHCDGKSGSVVELNCETDFVAKTDEFQKLGEGILQSVVAGGESAVQSEMVESKVKESGGKIGEKIVVRRAVRFEAKQGMVSSYRHHNRKIGILVQFEFAKAALAQEPDVIQTAKDVAMQIAALRPSFLSPNEVTADFLEREKAIFREQVKDKPANVQDKIIQGKLEKRYEDICLLNQKSVVDSSKTISQIVQALSKKHDCPISIKRFVRFEIGSE